MEPRALAVTPRLLILAAEPKWLAVADQVAVPKSLLLHATHVPVPVLESLEAKLVAVCSESVDQAAELKSPELAILVQVTAESVETSVLAVALKPLLAVLLLFAHLFWMASRV